MEEKQFKIEQIDPLGQGISRLNGELMFVAKTLPGEEGVARVLKKSQGVYFAVLNDPEKLTKKSEQRIQPDCPHYQQCGGCRYQHVPYQKELELKKQSLQYRLRQLFRNDITVWPAKERYSYRNRIQWHYHLPSKILGNLGHDFAGAIPTPDCLLPESELKDYVQNFLQTWTQEAKEKKLPDQGHIEFYLQHGQISHEWNQRYAHLGFSQINQQGNEQLKNLVAKLLSKQPEKKIVDLFGGNGNLTASLSQNPTLVIDMKIDKRILEAHQKPLEFDLYSAKNTLSRLRQKIVKALDGSPQILIVDPPRSGYRDLNNLIQKIPVEQIVYVSCDSATLERDLRSLKNFQIQEVHLLDFFPATHHYETLVHLSRKLE